MAVNMLVSNQLLDRSKSTGAARLSIAILRRHVGLMLGIILFPLLPMDLLVSFAALQIERAAESVTWLEGVAKPFAFYFLLLMTCINSTVVALIIGQLIEGNPPTLRALSFIVTKDRLRNLLGTDFFITALVLSPLILFSITSLFTRGDGEMQLWRIIFLIAAACLTAFLAANSLFSLYVAVFEDIYYVAAYSRSIELMKGRRWKFAGILGWTIVMMFIAMFPFHLVLELAGMPEAGIDSAASFAVAIYESLIEIGLELVVALYFAVLYLRRRQELHDLSFYEMQDRGVFQSATRIPES